MSTVKSRDLDSNGNPVSPPPWSELRYWAAGAVTLGLLILFLRVLFPPALPATVAPEATATPASATATLAPLLISAVGATPVAPEQAAPIPTAVPATAACPAASPIPPGARAGWLARASDCPHLILAMVAGERRWVPRPPELGDDLYHQLPEVPLP